MSGRWVWVILFAIVRGLVRGTWTGVAAGLAVARMVDPGKPMWPVFAVIAVGTVSEMLGAWWAFGRADREGER